jgi:hypothetical protein
LIFTFKKRSVDIGGLLLRDLATAGIDLDEMTSKGKKRINLLTWGDETSLNGYEHCDVVIMAGVLHRAYLDIAAAIVGQQNHLRAQVTNPMIGDLLRYEICHLIYQGASRGSCRTVKDGQAEPMKLYLIHRDLHIRAELAKVFKGAKWQLWQPLFMSSESVGVADQLALKVIDYLTGLSEAVTKVATREIKASLNLDIKDAGLNSAFTRAMRKVAAFHQDWILDGRSMVRTSSLFTAT